MDIEKRYTAFVKLGQKLHEIISQKPNLEFEEILYKTYNSNNWFTDNFVISAIQGILLFLEENELKNFLKKYSFPPKKPLRIGVIMAGNIPLAGFHDFLCVLLSGNIFVGKNSSKDDKMLQFISKCLIEIEPEFAERIEFTKEILVNPQAIIATGSNNSSRYFEYYFGKYPNIIRQNRNSVAVLSGSENITEIEKLGEDIFTFYGLGCRNVTKLYIPENYDFSFFFGGIEKFSYVLLNNKYKNNYDYYKSIFLVNQFPHLDNGFILLRNEVSIASSVAVLNVETYTSPEKVSQHLLENANKIQCCVSHIPQIKGSIPFGKAQQPAIDDFADGVDTMKFLLNL